MVLVFVKVSALLHGAQSHKLECAKGILILIKMHIPRSQILGCQCNVWGGVWESSFSQVKVVGLARFQKHQRKDETGVGLPYLSLLQSLHLLEMYTTRKI